MLIGSLVELHVRLHSCMCFSHLEKLVLKASSTPPWYLTVCQASSAFSYCNPDSFSTPGGSIENASASSIASQHLMDRLSFCSSIWWFVSRHLLDTCICRRQMSRHLSTPLDTFICQDLLLVYLSSLVRSNPHFSWSLSQYFSDFSPKLSHLTPIIVPQGFFKIFQVFLHLVSF